MKNRWLSVDEIAEYLGVSRDTIYSWLGDKKMPGHRAGHLWRFKENEVDEWIRAGKATPGSNKSNETAARAAETDAADREESADVG